MIDVLELIRRLQREREEQRKVPSHVELSALLTEVTKEASRELNDLYKKRICRDLRDALMERRCM